MLEIHKAEKKQDFTSTIERVSKAGESRSEKIRGMTLQQSHPS
jgi:hypothetical protein